MSRLNKCPKCGATNIRDEYIRLIALDGDVRQYECTNCNHIWTMFWEDHTDDKTTT